MSEEIRELDEMLESLNEAEIEEDVVLTEDGTYSDRQNNIYIGIFPDQGGRLYRDPYFKVSWRSINPTNDRVARISMRTGDYIIHNHQSVRVPNKIISRINNILGDRSGRCVNVQPELKLINPNPSVWEILLYTVAEYGNKPNEYYKLLRDFPLIEINPRRETLRGCDTIEWGKDR